MSKISVPKISLLTVSFDSDEKIKNLLTSLKKYPPKDSWELIVVDNNSPKKQNYDFLEKEKNVHLIRLNKNLGFGGGNEEGVRFSQGEFLVFINPDIEVHENCLDELLKTLQKDPTIGIVTPLLVSKDKKMLENTWDFPTPWQLLKRRLFSSREISIPEKNTAVAWAQGSFLVMKKSLFNSLDGFDSRFFLFFEDTDLCRRCWESKKKVVQIPTAQAFHTEHRLSGGNILGAMFKKTFWIHLLSAFKYFAKYQGQKNPSIN
ncbi:glycosyltransferase family 2 protein [Candidatus Gracilibacteria bacterium]|nr:glycosyltransferase family 2 protein [Candidatus Gracilibacteria bacterium]